MMLGVLKTEEHWWTLVKISVLASLFSSIYGFFQRGGQSDWIVGSGDRVRIFGTMGNTALFAGYEIVNLFFALLLVFRERYIMRWLFGFVFLADLIAIIMTIVRGSLLGIAVSLGLFSLWYLLYGPSRSVKIGLLALIILLAGFGTTLIIQKDGMWVRKSGSLTRLATVFERNRTVETRIWAWQAGINGWNDSAKTILLGWGPENFNIPFSKHFNPKFFSGPGSETLFDRAHNMFVEVLVTMGLLGAAAYLAMFAVLFWMLWRLYRQKQIEAVILACGLVAYMIHNAFIFDTSANFIIFFIFAGLVQALSIPTLQSGLRPISLGTTLRYSLISLAVLVVLFSIYRTNIRPVLANYATTRGYIALWGTPEVPSDHQLALKKFNQALEYDTFPSYELRHRYAQYVLENYGKFGTNIDIEKTFFSVIDHVEKNLESPMDYLPYLYISRLYLILGKSDPASHLNDLALQNSLAALEISPNFVRTYYEVAQAYINKKDFPNAIATFQKSIELNPEVAIGWWYMGVTQLEAEDQTGGLASVQKALELGHDAGERELLQLVAPYEKERNFTAIAKLYEKLIRLNPKNTDYHASLAAAYAQLGRINDAVNAAKIIVQINPALEAQVKAFVKQIGGTW